jgi:hypothetical protein
MHALGNRLTMMLAVAASWLLLLLVIVTGLPQLLHRASTCVSGRTRLLPFGQPAGADRRKEKGDRRSRPSFGVNHMRSDNEQAGGSIPAPAPRPAHSGTVSGSART